MEILQRKYGPLPAWGWMAIAAGGLYLYMRMRSGSSSDASASDTTGTDASQGQSVPYGSGYDTGFSAGVQAGENSVYQTPPAGSQYCRRMKSPDGHWHLVCGQGHFVKAGKLYAWKHGAAPTTTKRKSTNTKHYPVPTTRKTVRVH